MSRTIGKYKARIIAPPANVDPFGETSTGSAQIALNVRILAGPYEGQEFPWYGFFTTDTEDRTIQSLRFAGATFPKGDIRDLSGLGSADVSATLEEDEWEGKVRTRVAWINGWGQAPIGKPLGEGNKRALSERLRGKLSGGAPLATTGGGGGDEGGGPPPF